MAVKESGSAPDRRTNTMTNEALPRAVTRAPLFKPELRAALVVLGASVMLAIALKVMNPNTNSMAQIAAILVTSIFLVVASFGQGLAILLGGIDLSIGVVMGIGGMMIAGLTNGSNDSVGLAVLITLASCTAIGIVNGLGIALLNIAPFIMTLATGTTFFGVALGLTGGSSQRPVAPAIQYLMSGRFVGIPIPLLLIVLFLVVAIVLQNRTAEGRKLYAIGSNPIAAKIVGLPIAALTVAVYAISGLCAGIAGVLLTGYSSSATLDMGDAFLMPTIAAVVIGGARVTGGRGIYLATFAGAIFLSALATVITVLSLSQGWRNIIQGAMIVFALLLQSGTWKKHR
jgi:ribose transport system permease protein